MSCKTYNVMNGEPQLGKVTECVRTFTKSYIVDELTYAIVDEMIESTDSKIDFYEIDDVYVNEFITQDELDAINRELNNLYDDDYETGKEYEMVEKILNKYLPDNIEYVVETQSYV